MKDTRNLIITEKGKYLTSDKALATSTILYMNYEAPNQILATGKNKWAIQLDEREMSLTKYTKIRNMLKNIQLEIYKANKKHKDRRYRQQRHEKRQLEELELNSKATKIIAKQILN